MADRASVVQQVLIGINSTPGGTATNFKQFASVSVSPGIQMNRTPFRPIGHRYAGIVPPGKEWTQGATNGPITFEEIIYPLAGIFGSVAPTNMGTSAGTGYMYQWTPSNTALIVPQDFTIQQGDPVTNAHQFTYAYWTQFGFSLTRDALNHTGQLMGQRLTSGVSLAGGTFVTALGLVPALPENVNVFVDGSGAALGTTQYPRVLSVDWSNTNFHGPLWTLDSRQKSFAAPINMAPTTELKIKIEADTTYFNALLADARADNRKFVRVDMNGGSAGTSNYLVRLDFAGETKSIAPFADDQGVYAVEITYEATFDATWNNTQQITVINKTPTY